MGSIQRKTSGANNRNQSPRWILGTEAKAELQLLVGDGKS